MEEVDGVDELVSYLVKIRTERGREVRAEATVVGGVGQRIPRKCFSSIRIPTMRRGLELTRLSLALPLSLESAEKGFRRSILA